MKFKKACMSLLSILFINSNYLCSIAMNVPKKVHNVDDRCIVCLKCENPFDPNEQENGKKMVTTPCKHDFHLNCLMLYKDVGVYEHCLGIIKGCKRYCWLIRENQCPFCDEHLPSWFLKEINKDNSDSEYDSYDDE